MGNEECRMLKSKIGTEQVNYEGKEGRECKRVKTELSK